MTSLKSRIADVFLTDSFCLPMLLGVCGILLGLGFAIGDPAPSNYVSLLSFAGSKFWAVTFILYGCVKIISVFTSIKPIMLSSVSVFGIWAWNYLLLSFVVFDPTPAAPTEVLLAVPLLCDLWSLVQNIYMHGEKK